MTYGELVLEQEDIFQVKQTETRPYEYFDNVHTSINYEMNLDRIKIQRNVFSVFELLGDLGGMQTILLTIAGFVMTVFHY